MKREQGKITKKISELQTTLGQNEDRLSELHRAKEGAIKKIEAFSKLKKTSDALKEMFGEDQEDAECEVCDEKNEHLELAKENLKLKTEILKLKEEIKNLKYGSSKKEASDEQDEDLSFTAWFANV